MPADRQPALVVVVGLQKSGTTLLMRLLQSLPGFANPFGGEGADFWGDDPPFAPARAPCGLLYQQAGGDRGHVLGGDDAKPWVRALLARRLAALRPWPAVLVAKNPYHSVRLPWLRVLYPQALIVAMKRDPVANVYSLSKKFHDHPERGAPPVDGWWGVKPSNWQAMREPLLLDQLALQWRAVNAAISAGRPDLSLDYRTLTADPRAALRPLLAALGQPATMVELLPERLEHTDHEAQRGARLRSRNRDYLDQRRFELRLDTTIELPALSQTARARIKSLALGC